MRSASAPAGPARYLLSAWIALGLSAAGCGGRPADPVRTIDLIKSLGHAERRPSDASFQLAEHTFGGHARASIAAPVPSRITWRTKVPRRSILRVDAAVPSDPAGAVSVTFRLGISDDRVYESLVERSVTSADSVNGWTSIVANLSNYAGPKLSLFYQPDGRTWHIVLATDPLQGAAREAYWGEPGIDTDTAAARAYFRQLADGSR
jgi:hypothetical protein